MSSTAITATAAATPITAAGSPQPPIVYFLHLLRQVLSASVALVAFVARTASSIFNSFVPVSSAILYIFAPIFVLTSILFDVFIVTPYHVVAYLLHAFYPIYVLIGIACILACIIGLGARLIIHVAKIVFLRSSGAIQAPSIQISQAEENEKPKRKAQKRVSIKEEKHS